MPELWPCAFSELRPGVGAAFRAYSWVIGNPRLRPRTESFRPCGEPLSSR